MTERLRRSVACWFGALLVAIAAGACAHHQKDQTVCPEYRDLRCAGGVECSMDKERGCRVCQCKRVDEIDTDRPDERAQPPQ